MASPFKTFMHSTWVSSLHYFKDYAETKLLKICRMTIFKSCCTHCFSVFWEPHHFGICAKLLSMRTQNFKKSFSYPSKTHAAEVCRHHFKFEFTLLKRGKWKLKRGKCIKMKGRYFSSGYERRRNVTLRWLCEPMANISVDGTSYNPA